MWAGRAGPRADRLAGDASRRAPGGGGAAALARPQLVDLGGQPVHLGAEVDDLVAQTGGGLHVEVGGPAEGPWRVHGEAAVRHLWKGVWQRWPRRSCGSLPRGPRRRAVAGLVAPAWCTHAASPLVAVGSHGIRCGSDGCLSEPHVSAILGRNVPRIDAAHAPRWQDRPAVPAASVRGQAQCGRGYENTSMGPPKKSIVSLTTPPSLTATAAEGLLPGLTSETRRSAPRLVHATC